MICVWCIKHRDGWCATQNGEKPSKDAWSDATACGNVVTMRVGSGIREPDCEECRAALSVKKARGR